MLTVCHDAAMEKVDQLAAQLKSETLKRLNLEDSVQHCDTFRAEIEQVMVTLKFSGMATTQWQKYIYSGSNQFNSSINNQLMKGVGKAGK